MLYSTTQLQTVCMNNKQQLEVLKFKLPSALNVCMFSRYKWREIQSFINVMHCEHRKTERTEKKYRILWHNINFDNVETFLYCSLIKLKNKFPQMKGNISFLFIP